MNAKGRQVPLIDAIVRSPPAPFTVIHESIQALGNAAVIIDVSEAGT